jgi:MFS family permease
VRPRAHWWRFLVVDVTPLRESVEFRWFFYSQAGGSFARQLLVVAVPYEVYIRTHSTVLVGLIGLVQVGPLIVCSQIGGVVADTLDRRRVLITVEVLLALTSVGFGLNSMFGPLWVTFVIVAGNAGLSGMESPARTAMVPALVGGRRLVSAFSLNQSLNQTMQVVGPALAGPLMAAAGIRTVYVVAAAASIATAAALLRLTPRGAPGAGERPSLRGIREGWGYVRRVPLLQQAMLIDLNAMVFGMPRALFPAIGTGALGGGPVTVGLLHAAPGAGALVGALTTGWVASVRRQGRVVVVAVVVWGLAIAGFGISRTLAVALVLLAVAGAADVVSNVFRNTILQTAVPDQLRGRTTAIKDALAGAGPRVGDAEAGAVASLTSTTIAVVSGGVASAAGGLVIAVLGRSLWRQESEDAAAVSRSARSEEPPRRTPPD